MTVNDFFGSSIAFGTLALARITSLNISASLSGDIDRFCVEADAAGIDSKIFAAEATALICFETGASGAPPQLVEKVGKGAAA